MAIKTYVTGSSTATIADNDVTVVGGTAGSERVKIASGVTGTTLDGNVEKVDLAGSLADYKFVFIAGTGFQIQTVAGAVVTTIQSVNQASTVAFADGSATLTQTGNASVTLGNQTIGTTLVATTATALGATFDTTVKSTVAPVAAAGAGQAFALTSSATGDVFVGSVGNDTIAGGAGTVGSSDVVLDASSTDSDVANLNITGVVGSATLSKIENVNLAFGFAGSFDLTNVSGATAVNLTSGIAGNETALLIGVGTAAGNNVSLRSFA